jgi:2'-hydroxyisoflavone reductase
MEAMLAVCRRVTASDAAFTWVTDEFLLGRGVQPWTECPLWIPASAGSFLYMNQALACEAGLRSRPLAKTIADILKEPPNDAPLSGGCSRSSR